jgi:hypothetical protein
MTETIPNRGVTPNGLTVYDEFTDTYPGEHGETFGSRVWVQESGAAMSKVWIFCDSEGEAAPAHLDIGQAERVRDALDQFIREAKETKQAESLAAADDPYGRLGE